MFIATGILSARYLRRHWPDNLLIGIRMWFNLHRAANLIGVAYTICGFVIIFAANDWRWTGPRPSQSNKQNREWSSIHSILGLLACVIAWAQPLNAVFRCQKATRFRTVFNAIHRFFGISAFVLAMATIMIACVHFDAMFSNRNAALGLFITYVATLGAAVILMEIVKFIRWRSNENPRSSSPASTGGPLPFGPYGSSYIGHVADKKENTKYNIAILVIFFCYLAVAVGVAVAISILIGLGL